MNIVQSIMKFLHPQTLTVGYVLPIGAGIGIDAHTDHRRGWITMGLQAIQERLKVPKSQFNSFGKYHYRSCEDILEVVKPLLAEHECELVINDEIIEVGGRIYVKATASLYNAGGSLLRETCGLAREPESKKGMDESQITGAASSYARKYALNGLFLIDDVKDADHTNKHGVNGNGGKKDRPRPQPQGNTAEQMVDNVKKVFNLDDVRKLNPNQKRATLQQILNKCTADEVGRFKQQYKNLAKVPVESLDAVIAEYSQLAKEK